MKFRLFHSIPIMRSWKLYLIRHHSMWRSVWLDRLPIDIKPNAVTQIILHQITKMIEQSLLSHHPNWSSRWYIFYFIFLQVQNWLRLWMISTNFLPPLKIKKESRKLTAPHYSVAIHSLKLFSPFFPFCFYTVSNVCISPRIISWLLNRKFEHHLT